MPTAFERRARLLLLLRDPVKRQKVHQAAQEVKGDYPAGGDAVFVALALRASGAASVDQVEPTRLVHRLLELGWRNENPYDYTPDPGDVWYSVERLGSRLVNRVGIVVERPNTAGQFVTADALSATTRNLGQKRVDGIGRAAVPVAGWLVPPEVEVNEAALVAAEGGVL